VSSFAIGQSVPRKEDRRLLTGRGLFLDDLELPGQTRGVVLRSPRAHAAIRSIDTTQAAAAAGMLAVLTGRYVIADRLGGLQCEESRRLRDNVDGSRHERSTSATGGSADIANSGGCTNFLLPLRLHPSLVSITIK
jgi:CO/xanthine dehydrogenase Mo-binding subunit